MKHYLPALFLLFSLNTYAQGSLEGDRLALVALYNSTDGPNWFMNAGWTVAGPAGSSPCGWYGVTCESDRVTGLDLSKSGLNGNIAPEIGNLNQLKSLTLGWSRLPGDDGIYWPMPTEIGNLLNLEHLDLSGNTGRDYDWRSGAMPIGGPIPPSLGNLTKLTYLDLSYLPNDAGFDPFGFLSGSIPSELGNLVNLKTLDFRHNKLTGSIPSSFTNLTKLVTLDLSVNQLSGPIPSLSGIPITASVNISNNQFIYDGLETNINILDIYSPQSKIPIVVYNAFPLPYIISVEAGGIETNYQDNNTYKFFKDGVLMDTQHDDHIFIMGGGTYRVEVTNSIATNLTLYSQEIFVPLGAMPVTIISFSGKYNSNVNELTWKTTSETNNSGFDIERSADAKTFEKIGYVDGNGNSKENKTYNFTDQNPFSTTYYRLKQIDYDEKSEYSRIISVKKDLSGISIYPNPAGSQLFLKDLEKEENITIRNSAGLTILHQKLFPKQSVNTTHFSNGLYTISFGEETRKVVIQK